MNGTIVTGGASGLDAAIAATIAKAGKRLVVLNPETGQFRIRPGQR